MEIDLRPFIPDVLQCERTTYRCNIDEAQDAYVVSYLTTVANKYASLPGRKRYEYELPKTISLDAATFEVLGLLQGEMSKTYRRALTFTNCEPEIINAVLRWFKGQLCINFNEWKWYIRLNIPEPIDEAEVWYYQEELMNYWIRNCPINEYMQYNKVVSFVKNTKNIPPKNNGTLMIERTGPVFIQTVQKLVHDITASMPDRAPAEIIPFMRGVIAAEACINFRPCCCHRRVFITATIEEEREVFRNCLHKIGIQTKDCKPLKDIIISGRENILKLHQLGLMTLNPEKRARFEAMVESYSRLNPLAL